MGSPPSALVEKMVNNRVTVQLKDSRTISGRLLGCDEHLNMVLDEAEEKTPELARRLGLIVLRGSNVIAVNSALGAAVAAH